MKTVTEQNIKDIANKYSFTVEYVKGVMECMKIPVTKGNVDRIVAEFSRVRKVFQGEIMDNQPVNFTDHLLQWCSDNKDEAAKLKEHMEAYIGMVSKILTRGKAIEEWMLLKMAEMKTI